MSKLILIVLLMLVIARAEFQHKGETVYKGFLADYQFYYDEVKKEWKLDTHYGDMYE